jgi:hypothetical protein
MPTPLAALLVQALSEDYFRPATESEFAALAEDGAVEELERDLGRTIAHDDLEVRQLDITADEVRGLRSRDPEVTQRLTELSDRLRHARDARRPVIEMVDYDAARVLIFRVRESLAADPNAPPEVRLMARIRELEAERDEADRRAGAAERRAAGLEETAFKRRQWLDKAKRAAGFSTDVSFDVVWAQALEAYKAQQAGTSED